MSSSTSSQRGCGSACITGVPALLLVRDLAIEALCCRSEDMPDVVHSGAGSAGTLGQVPSISAGCEIGKLVKQLQALQEQTAILHLQQALCSAALPTPNSINTPFVTKAASNAFARAASRPAGHEHRPAGFALALPL